jgi:hypothetical protein
MEMRWEKLYSGGLGEFRRAERAICRPARLRSRLNGLWIRVLVTAMVIGAVLVFI